MEKGAQKQEMQNKKVVRRLLGKTLFGEYNLQRCKAIRKIRPEGRMDAKNRWWVSELLAADCEKAWIHTGWVAGAHEEER